MRMQSPIVRRQSRRIMVGNVPVGGDAPIAVQSMTNTDTCDVQGTLDTAVSEIDSNIESNDGYGFQ